MVSQHKLMKAQHHISFADVTALPEIPLSLQLACLSHFQTQEFSYLMAESSEASEALIAELPKPDRQRLLELLDLPLRSTAGSAALQKALTEAADWKLALKMLQKIATGVGHHAGMSEAILQEPLL